MARKEPGAERARLWDLCELKVVGFSRKVLSDPQFKKAASCREMWSFKPSLETGRSKRLDIQINKRVPSDHHSPREFGFGNS